MAHVLVEVLSQMTPLSEPEKRDIEQSFPIKVMEKGTHLLRIGQVAREAHYVVRGCVRAYELMEGEEKTTAFHTEGDSVANFNSLSNQTPSRIAFVCTEETTVAVLNAEKEQQLYQKHPRFETFCRQGMEKMFGEKQGQIADFIALKPESRYLKLLEERPGLINRVPQYQLASYLGIKPETLSRIRKRLAKN